MLNVVHLQFGLLRFFVGMRDHDVDVVDGVSPMLLCETPFNQLGAK